MEGPPRSDVTANDGCHSEDACHYSGMVLLPPCFSSFLLLVPSVYEEQQRRSFLWQGDIGATEVIEFNKV